MQSITFKTKKTVILITLILAAMFLLLQPASTHAEAVQLAPPAQDGLTDPAEMEAFMDDMVAATLAKYHVPGATVSVVNDGELFFAKGYGYADVEAQKPVIADQTLFRPGSVSKLFTWTAVMQLAEQGKVDLHADINTYLHDFQIPATFNEPITLAHLMTHSAGFEDVGEGLFVLDAEQMMPLADYAERYTPTRIYPPSEFVAYSNYGTSLAGYIVESVSGMSFEQYVEENILIPLEMTHSSYRQPLPPALADDLAVGYQYVEGAYQPLLEWTQGRPAGGASATAVDMANFMIAHLQDGRFKNSRILQESTAQEMHAQHYNQEPKANGMAYGFMEMEMNGQKIIWHGGATAVFHTAFILLPEQNVGLFVSFNSDDGWAARESFTQAFMDHYYPGGETAVSQPSPDFTKQAERFIGTYQGSRHNENSPEKLLSLNTDVSIRLTPDNLLETINLDAATHQWMATEDALLFIRDDGNETLIFQEDAEGNIVSFVIGNVPIETYLKKSLFDTVAVTMPWGMVCLLFFLITILIWPLKFIVNQLRRKQPADSVPMASKIARWLGWGYSALSLFFVVAFMGMMMSPTIKYGLPPEMEQLLLIPNLTALMAVGMVIFTGFAWVRRYWSFSGRVYYTLLTVTAVAFLGWLSYWNLLSFQM